MPAPIKVGFVGLSSSGWAVSHLAQPILSTGKYAVTAVSTTNEASAKASAEVQSKAQGNKPVKAYHGDTASISADPNVDLVAISVKTPLHVKAAIPAIEAGKDVFIEWPVGSGLEDTKKLAEAAKKKGVRSLVGVQRRFNPAILKVKELVDSGKIGKVLSTHIIALNPLESGVWGPRMLERSKYMIEPGNGASLLSIALGHQLDSLTHVLGPFSSVSSTATLHHPIAEVINDKDQTPTGEKVKVIHQDHIAVTGLLKDGGLVSIIWRSGHKSEKGRRQFLWEIDGEKGVIRVESNAVAGAFIMNVPDVYVNDERVDLDTANYSDGGDVKALFEEFAKGDKGVYPTLEDAVTLKTLLDAIERSYTGGKRITL